MRTKNELYQEAMRTVAARRQMARARAEDARAEAEAAIPALRHAEEEVRVRGIRCALAGAAGKDRTEAAAALADAKQKLTALLAQSGRPADALEPRFICPKCQDTGSVNGRTCECVHKVMQQLRRKEIEALSSLSIASFDTMELRYYPNRADEKVGGSIRPYMADMLADLRSYAEEFDHHSESLMLFGNAGLGKTHAALAIAGIVLEKGYDVIYVSSPDFFSKLEGLHFGADPAGEEETLMQTAAGADLLILDEPTSGLDPLVRDEILDIFLDFLQDETRAVILSSHITSDLDKVADTIALLHEGKLLFHEEKDVLREDYAVVKGGADQRRSLNDADFIGVHENAFGFEALCRRDVARRYPALTAERPTIEEIMLFYTRKKKGGRS